MTHPSELATMAENVANCIVNATPPGIDAEASGATVTITDSYQHRRYTLTVEAAEVIDQAWAVVVLYGRLVQSVGVYTDRPAAEAAFERETNTPYQHYQQALDLDCPLNSPLMDDWPKDIEACIMPTEIHETEAAGHSPTLD